MANPGVLSITVELAKDLKDSDWFGKQDPYCVVKVGEAKLRTKTAVDGGRNPVWNEDLTFNVDREDEAKIKIMDDDAGSRDDTIGVATFSLAKVREAGSEQLRVAVAAKKGKTAKEGKARKPQGFVSLSLRWTEL